MSLFYGYCLFYFFNYRPVFCLFFFFSHLRSWLLLSILTYDKQVLLQTNMFVSLPGKTKNWIHSKWKYIAKLNSPTMTKLISRDRSICNFNLFSLIEYGHLVLCRNKILKMYIFKSKKMESSCFYTSVSKFSPSLYTSINFQNGEAK